MHIYAEACYQSDWEVGLRSSEDSLIANSFSILSTIEPKVGKLNCKLKPANAKITATHLRIHGVPFSLNLWICDSASHLSQTFVQHQRNIHCTESQDLIEALTCKKDRYAFQQKDHVWRSTPLSESKPSDFSGKASRPVSDVQNCCHSLSSYSSKIHETEEYKVTTSQPFTL